MKKKGHQSWCKRIATHQDHLVLVATSVKVGLSALAGLGAVVSTLGNSDKGRHDGFVDNDLHGAGGSRGDGSACARGSWGGICACCRFWGDHGGNCVGCSGDNRRDWVGATTTWAGCAKIQNGVCGVVARQRIDIVVVKSIEAGAGWCSWRASPGWARADGGLEVHSFGVEWAVCSSAVDIGSIIPNKVGAVIWLDSIFQLSDFGAACRLGDLQRNTTGGRSVVTLLVRATGGDGNRCRWVARRISSPHVYVVRALVVDDGITECLDAANSSRENREGSNELHTGKFGLLFLC
jgi:hypothetical protein